MKLTTFTPEVSRLRRLAKACAAGEVSRTEYRAARRRVIEALSRDPLRDDTIPRFDGDTTVRRSVIAPEVMERKYGIPWWAWFVMGALLVMAAGAAAETIPPLKDRKASQTYAVERVLWTPASELRGLESSEVQAVLDGSLKATLGEQRPQQHGFTDDELKQVGRFLNAVGVHEERQLRMEDLQDLNALIARQKRARGISMVQLEAVADDLEAWLVKAGYPLARVYIPAQEVIAGEVQLGVQVGVVSEVVAVNDSTLSSREQKLLAQVEPLLGQRVEKSEFETRFNLINRNGAALQAAFRPGETVGSTELNVRMNPERQWQTNVFVDNHGAERLGEERLTASVKALDMIFGGDAFDGYVRTHLDGDGALGWGLGYRTPHPDKNLTLGGGLQMSEVDSSDIGLEGQAARLHFDVLDTQLFRRSERLERKLRIGYDSLEWDDTDLEEQSVYASIGLAGHRLFDSAKWALEGQADLIVGDQSESFGAEDGLYWGLAASGSAWTPLNVLGGAKLILDSRLLYSTDALPVVQRLQISTVERNAGLDRGAPRADRGVEVSAALRWSKPSGEWWVSLDTGYGEAEYVLGADLTLLDRDVWYQLSTFGGGWQYSLAAPGDATLTSRIAVGYPVAHKSNYQLDDDGVQVYWSLHYRR